jgi:hypothetical protein
MTSKTDHSTFFSHFFFAELVTDSNLVLCWEISQLLPKRGIVIAGAVTMETIEIDGFNGST